MVKLLGAACVLGAAVWAWRRGAKERRRELDTLADLIVLLDRMEGEIRLRKRLEELELSECILTGSVSDREELRLFYARADLFLFPSLYDANSIVQIEAASQRTPAVFLEGAATASTVTAGRNGYLAPNDPAAFADKILAVLPNELDRLTPEEAEKKRTAFESVREYAFRELYLTWDQLAEKVLKDYEKIVADYRSEHGEKR